MKKADSWEVDALRLYLRTVMSRQLRDLENGTRETFRRVIDKTPDSTEVEALEKILRIRERLQSSQREIMLEDHGAGARESKHQRTVSSIHQSSAVPHWWGVFLFRLVRELKPKTVLELGANLGVSGAYIQSALDLNGGESRFTTIEGDPTLASLARETLDSIGNGNRDVVLGRFQDVLQPVLDGAGRIDLVFIDGHHEYRPTLDYFERIRPSLSRKATVVFDDIYLWSRPVRRAWKEIVRTYPESRPIDLAKFGILIWST